MLPYCCYLQICTVVLATLTQDQMVDLLKTSQAVSLTVVPPHSPLSPPQNPTNHHTSMHNPAASDDDTTAASRENGAASERVGGASTTSKSVRTHHQPRHPSHPQAASLTLQTYPRKGCNVPTCAFHLLMPGGSGGSGGNNDGNDRYYSDGDYENLSSNGSSDSGGTNGGGGGGGSGVTTSSSPDLTNTDGSSSSKHKRPGGGNDGNTRHQYLHTGSGGNESPIRCLSNNSSGYNTANSSYKSLNNVDHHQQQQHYQQQTVGQQQVYPQKQQQQQYSNRVSNTYPHQQHPQKSGLYHQQQQLIHQQQQFLHQQQLNTVGLPAAPTVQAVTDTKSSRSTSNNLSPFPTDSNSKQLSRQVQLPSSAAAADGTYATPVSIYISILTNQFIYFTPGSGEQIICVGYGELGDNRCRLWRVTLIPTIIGTPISKLHFI